MGNVQQGCSLFSVRSNPRAENSEEYAHYRDLNALEDRFLSCLLFLFSLVLWVGFFLVSFFVSRDFDMVCLQ